MDKDIEREAMKLSAPDASQITGQLSGDDYIWNTRTLSDEEVMEVFNKIIKEVEEKTSAKLRS